MSRLLAVLFTLVLVVATWEATRVTLDRVRGPSRRLRRQHLLGAELVRRLGPRLPNGLLPLLEAGPLEAQSLRALETLARDPRLERYLVPACEDLVDHRGHLPDEAVLQWSGLEPRGEYAPPESIRAPLLAVRHTRRFPLEPSGREVLAAWLAWGLTLGTLLALARALRAPAEVWARIPGALPLALPAGLLGLAGTLLALDQGSAPVSKMVPALLERGSELLGLGLVAACGLSLPPPGVPAGESPSRSRTSPLLPALAVGLLLLAWTGLLRFLLPWEPGPALRRAESLRQVLGLLPPTPLTQVLAGVGAALGEELLFRLLLLRAACTRMAPGKALALVTLAWVLPHLGSADPEWVRLLQLLPAGWILGLLALRRGPVPAMLAHATWNAGTILLP